MCMGGWRWFVFSIQGQCCVQEGLAVYRCVLVLSTLYQLGYYYSYNYLRVTPLRDILYIHYRDMTSMSYHKYCVGDQDQT